MPWAQQSKSCAETLGQTTLERLLHEHELAGLPLQPQVLFASDEQRAHDRARVVDPQLRGRVERVQPSQLTCPVAGERPLEVRVQLAVEAVVEIRGLFGHTLELVAQTQHDIVLLTQDLPR